MNSIGIPTALVSAGGGRASRAQFYPAGVTLFRQGFPAEDVFCIHHGLVKLHRIQSSGDEVIVGLRSEGWFVAVTAALLHGPHMVTGVTVTPCEIFRLTAEKFDQLLRNDVELSLHVHRMHSEEIHDQMVQTADRNYFSGRERLERVFAQFVRIGARADRRGRFEIDFPLRHWEVAQLVGVTPQYLSRLLSDLKRLGRAEWKGRCVVLGADLVRRAREPRSDPPNDTRAAVARETRSRANG